MKLAICLFHYRLHSGLSRDFLSVALEALKRGHEVTVLTQSWQGEEMTGIELHIVSASGISNHRRSWNFARACQAILNEGGFDAVIGFNRMPGLDYYFAADVSFVSLAEKNYGCLNTLTGRYRTYKKLEQAVFSEQSKTHIFSLSESQSQDYQRVHRTPNQRFTILPPAVNLSELEKTAQEYDRNAFRRAQGIEADHFLLLMVGSDFRTKGVDLSIQALAKLPLTTRRRCTLAVLGSGKVAAMEKLAERLGVDQLTRLLGPVDDVFEWMLAADLLLHPSRVEAAGNSIVEALASGLAVIVSNTSGFAVHVDRAQAGILLSSDAFDVAQFSDAIRRSLNSSTLTEWRRNALHYSANTQLNGRAATLLNTVESRASLWGNSEKDPIPLRDL